MSDDKLKKAKNLRLIEYNRMSELHDFALKTKSNKSLFNELHQRYESIGNIKDNFYKHHNSVFSLISTDEDDESFKKEDKLRSQFDCFFYATKTIYFDIANEKSCGKQQKIEDSMPKAKLPELKLAKFSGDIKNFVSFIDVYDALIHTNVQLSNIEKFSHLLSLLDGEPKALVQRYPLSSLNYELAYQALKERYSNQRLLATFHWNEIDNAPFLQDENPVNLRKLIDTFNENISALKNLQYPTQHWDFVLTQMLLKRLSPLFITRFESFYAKNEMPEYDELNKFLNSQCTAYETIASSSANYSKLKPNQPSQSPRQKRGYSAFLTSDSNQINRSCIFCRKQNHLLFKCPYFLHKTPAERIELANQNRLCKNCLSTTHSTKFCNSEINCRFCQQRHHSLLHVNNFKGTFTRDQPQTQNQTSFFTKKEKKTESSQNNPLSQLEETKNANEFPECQSGPVLSTTCHFSSSNGILLSTIKLRICDNFGKYHVARALLDSGSESCYISRELALNLSLPVHKSKVNICGLAGMSASSNLGCTEITIKPFNKEFPLYDLNAIILDKVCTNMPNITFDIRKWTHINNLNLADPEFNISDRVDMILGADIFHKILLDGKVSMENENLPSAINTVFGYVLMGNFHSNENISLQNVNTFFTLNPLTSLENTLKNFFDLEEVPQTNLISDDDKKCEEIYLNTTYRTPEGRYVVFLPFRENFVDFKNSKFTAIRQFLSLEKRLNINPPLKKEYSKCIQEYMDSNHMELVPQEQQNIGYFLPHHCILKPNALTTQLRVVFNASVKDENNTSLNDVLFIGPKLQKDIAAILLNFRRHRIVMTADIKGMYKQILINPAHRIFQKILWRFSQSEPLREYMLNTVTFGINCSPYLALRTVMQLARDERLNHELASDILLNDIFVDDIVTGFDSLPIALQAQNQLISIFEKGGFELRKWASNNQEFLYNLPFYEKREESYCFDLEPNTTIKVLGLKWNPLSDTFFYSVNPQNKPCTKRNILSECARVYDPLSLLCPIIILAKILIQELWSIKLDWDAEPPKKILNKWQNYKEQLCLLGNLKIPRLVIYDYPIYLDLCGFCDGSLQAYAACIYIRVVYNNKIETNLLCSKSKVTPLKRLTIPRIELSAALLLAKLFKFVLDTYNKNLVFKNIFGFTDSMVVLHWLNSSPYKWKPFVGNRISLIQETIPTATWYHVPSDNNIADIASRGMLPQDFLKKESWWIGPPFLKLTYDQWPVSQVTPSFSNKDINVEKRKIAFFTATDPNPFENLLNKFSSLNKILLVLAYVLRFINNSKNKSNKNISHIIHHELNQGLTLLIKYVQSSHFSDEISNLKNKRLLSKSFRKLGCFLDENNILRVGGRLQNSLLNYETKFPIILPRTSVLTDLIIKDTHEKYCHPGMQTLHFLLLQNYWIMSPRRAIKRVLSKCIKCWRLNPIPYQPPMGNLPSNRISQVKPFSVVGIDLGGPLYVTQGKNRKAKAVKSYVCIFVCFATKAIHIELVTDLSTENFLCALRRFIARRGKCVEIVSDNGKNFVGANRYLIEIFKNAAAEERIKWSFQPPYGSHFGGLYEAGIKSVKSHLARVIGSQILTYEELNTFIIQVEALLNSRPLYAMSSDPNDLNVLTPGHFLTLQPLTCLPDPDISHININRLDRYQLLLKLHADFWSRWHKEYLHTLYQKSKWHHPNPPLKEGILVLEKQDNVAPMKWKLCRVKRFIYGKDNIARVAEIFNSQGTFIRPLVKLCPLPEP